MYIECRHITPAGFKCTVPRIDDDRFCFDHRNLHNLMPAPQPAPGTPFRMPLLEDASGLRIALQEVSWAMGDKRITQREAGIYLRVITIAKGLLPRHPDVTTKPVRSLCYDNDGFEMGEAVTNCDPPRDCVTCENPCDWFPYYEDEVEEIEQQIAEEEQQKKLESWKAENPGVEPPPDLQPAPEPDRPWKGKYDNEDPAVRAICEFIEEKEYKEMLALQAIEKARIKSTEAPGTTPVSQQRLSS
ncbi:MAG: hypothetical protein JST28_05235 [Acidobacteria bacterium]|nr:hypothetical protein [Acidobacteriota bacterium]